MAAITPMYLEVPAGNNSFPKQVREKLAERAAYWRVKWEKEKSTLKKSTVKKRRKHVRSNPKWRFIGRTVNENFPSVNRNVSIL